MTVALWLAKAERSLKTAGLALTDGDSDAACNRAYYAMFNAARAALIAVGQDQLALAKTHSGLVASFAEHLVKTGHISLEQGRALAAESKRRMVGDYQGGGLSEKDANDAIANATHFLAKVNEFVGRYLNNQL
jgi:uncharacterized protein (UPF0332 family)